ncbi:MAG: exodeoxyribonuclease VII large subunit [Pseudomonadota bacterium]|nr:exodeoxyribonuclease VII large subunit [Pseudomonadota bacterium]
MSFDRLPTPTPGDARIFTVSALNREVRALLDRGLPVSWVEGEISNFAAPSSGHWYFSLKDAKAQVRCAMFRQRNQAVQARPQNGAHVLIKARASLYEPRGEYQLIVEHLEPAGEGALRQAYEALKRKLAAEGLFSPEHKKTLPPFPRRIGIITSPTGAAIRDILNVLKRRFPTIPLVLYPVAVQGDEAAPQIVRAIETATRRAECDVLIVGRGGGSLEDLWAFNEEIVARAIHACPIPVISAVGHEIDVTIADFVADVRAPTPSAAAEIAVPDAAEVSARVERLLSRLVTWQQHRMARHRDRLATLEARLRRCHPAQRLRQQSQRLDELEQRLARAMELTLERRRHRLSSLATRLAATTPTHRLNMLRQRLERAQERLHRAMQLRLESSQRRFHLAARALSTVSPLATLERGYAIARTADGVVLRDSQQTQVGDPIHIRLAHGELDCEITQVRTEQHEP